MLTTAKLYSFSLLYVKLNKIVQKERSSNLPMVSESLTLTFYLLTGYYSRQQPSSLRFGDVIFVGMKCVGVKRFLRFSRRRQHGFARKFFSGFRRKRLIITTHVEKQCTQALNFCLKQVFKGKNMIGKNCIGKKQKSFLNTMQNISPVNSLPLPRNRQNVEMISLSYDVNDYVYSKSKSSCLTSWLFKSSSQYPYKFVKLNVKFHIILILAKSVQR